ncbi:MAG: isoprenylcysteine carboxylmethyltransferase family protein [Acidobacteriota bacterium]|nr:isoprenylcysteine carboxylmethyltransferase family protein [Acidobacteriota bacterium]
MNPRTLLLVVCALWVASEVALGVAKRSRSGESSRKDRASLILLWIGITASVYFAIALQRHRATEMPGGIATFYAGIAILLLGVVLRWIAIITLWRYFTVDVAIRHDHRIISHGIYSIVRHPSYSGAVLSFAGFGIALRNWASLVILTLGALFAFSYRIAIEERALVEAFGEEYRAYAKKTKRLIPGIY